MTNAIIRFRRGTAAQWASVNPLLTEGESGWETDTGKFKVGDGIRAWNNLPYASGAVGPQGPMGPMIEPDPPEEPQMFPGPPGQQGIQGPDGPAGTGFGGAVDGGNAFTQHWDMSFDLGVAATTAWAFSFDFGGAVI